jgi:predicted dehydrogenase
LIADPNVEAVIIALPLHLHAQAAIQAMLAGKDVLTEKLMGHSVPECKEMARFSEQTGKLLATGHQRHYSILYDNAVDTIRRGLLGNVHSIRAQWHRDNLPGTDSWQQPLPDEAMEKKIAELKAELDAAKGAKIDKLVAKIAGVSEAAFGTKRDDYLATLAARLTQQEKQYADHQVEAGKFGYISKTISPSKTYTPLEELIRWRLFQRTGGGLMAELGSHQLDAAGIFISAMSKDGKKALPLNVSAVGGRYVFPADRECEDHVYCIYEFPTPEYDPQKSPDAKVGVTYSSINGNGYGGYGEVVMGTQGTLILEREQEVMMFKNSAVSTRVTVKEKKGAGPVLDTTASGAGPAAAVAKKAVEAGPVSRGYTEEIEHWAWCIRNRAPENIPRCHPAVALGDAVIALTTNIAIRENRRIDFRSEWFDYKSDETPEGVKPDLSKYQA